MALTTLESPAPSSQGRTPLALPDGVVLLLASELMPMYRLAPKFSFGFRRPSNGSSGPSVALHRPRPERTQGPRDAQEHGSERAAARGGDPGANPSPWSGLPTVPQRSARPGPDPNQPTLSCSGFSYWAWGLSPDSSDLRRNRLWAAPSTRLPGPCSMAWPPDSGIRGVSLSS